MNCNRIFNSLSAYIDGELTGAEMLEIRGHLGECEKCAQEYESLRLTKRLVAGLSTVAPRPDLAASIISRLDAAKAPAHQRLLDSFTAVLHRRLAPVAAAAGACALAFVFLSNGAVETPGVPAASSVAESAYGFHSGGPHFISNVGNSVFQTVPSGEPLQLVNEPESLVGGEFSNSVIGVN